MVADDQMRKKPGEAIMIFTAEFCCPREKGLIKY